MCDSVDELEGQIGKFLIGVDESLKEGQLRVDIFSSTLGEDISINNNLIDLVQPNLFNKQETFLLVGRTEQGILFLPVPLVHKLLLIVGVGGEIDIYLHNIFEMFGHD